MTVVVAAILLALPLGGCKLGRLDVLPVGTCVRESAEGTATVPCAEPHTHRVIAVVAGEGGACPPDTDMAASPADPDEGRWTICFQTHTATR
jgi:hypothetical protein